jgi:hypothetical protein
VKLKDAFFDIRDGGNLVASCVANSIVKNFTDDQHATLACDMNTSNLVNGHTYTLRIHASDYAGYGGGQDVPLTFDTTNPSVAASMSSTTINKQTTTEPTVTINASDTVSGIDYVQYKVMDSSNATVLGWVTISNGTATPVSGILGLNDGTYTLRARAFDNAGNKKSGADVAFTVDKTAPAVSIDSYGWTNNAMQPTISVDGSTTPTGYTYSWTTDPNVDISNVNALNPIFTVNQDGTYNFNLTVTDAAGNSTTVPMSLTYTTPAAPQQGGTPANPFTIAAAQQPPGGAGTPAITPLADNGTGTTTPEVKGASTDKAVKGDNVVKFENSGSKKGSGNFLALGWWWIPVIVVVAFLWWLLAARRSEQD